MTALLAAPLAVAAPPGPLPDGQTIDSLTYDFTPDGPLGPGGTLSIGADGKVRYSHATAPQTGSGGRVTQKQWQLPADERKELFRKLVGAGLLDMPAAKGPFRTPHLFTAGSGRWEIQVGGGCVPPKVMEVLRPLLVKAHPELWGEKAGPKEGRPESPRLTMLRYTLTPKAGAVPAVLTVYRVGVVEYARKGEGGKEGVSAQWKVPAKDAEELLDGLAADGLFDLGDTLGGRFPNHSIHAEAGRWKLTFHPKELPEKFLKRFLPLLREADADFWK